MTQPARWGPPLGGTDSCGGVPTGVPASQASNLYQEDCAKAGIRALLATLDPCTLSFATCPSDDGTDNVPAGDALDEVGLVAFPGRTPSEVTSSPTAPVPDDLNCTKDYNSYSDWTYGSNATYQIVPFSSDFRYSDTSNPNSPLATLNPASNLVRSVYWPGDGCGANGGYPIDGSAPPISGGGSGDIRGANNTASAIAGGIGTAGDSTSTVDAGITQGKSTYTSTGTGIVEGSSTNGVTNTLTIGGGPNSGSANSNTTSTGLAGDSNNSGVFPSSSNTPLYGAAGASLDLTTNSTNGNEVPAATTVTALNVTLSGSTAGSTATLTVTVMKNGQPTSLVCTVTAPSTTFSCAGGPVSFSGSDTVNLKFSRTTGGVPFTNPTATWTLTSSATGIAINRPANAAANDFLLVTVTGGGAAVTGSSNICPNSATTGWSLVDLKRVSGTLIQATYSSVRPTAAAETYTFNFFTSGLCSADTGTGNLTLAASADVLRYTNVSSVDVAGGATGVPSSTNLAGSAPGTTWGTTPEYISVSTACQSVTASTCTTTPSAAGTITSASLIFSANLAAGQTYAVNLLEDGNSVANCTIAAGAKTCPLTGLNVAVNGTSDTIELEVVQTAGTTSLAGTAATTAVESTTSVANIGAGPTPTEAFGTTPWYVSLGPPACASTTLTGSCDTAPLTSAGTLTGVTLTLSANENSHPDHYTVTLLQNGVAKGTCQIGFGANSCPINPNLAVAVADKLELEIVRSGGSQNLTATSAGTENVTNTVNFAGIGSSSTTTWGTSNEYVSLSTECVSASATACTTTPVAGTVTSATMTFASATGAGQTYAVNLLEDGNSVANCTITTGTKTCSMTGLNVAVNGTSDTIELEVAQTAGTTSYIGSAVTAAVETTGGLTLTAPSVTTNYGNERIVRLFGTGATSFATANGLPLTVASTATATGANDTSQAAPGPAGTATVTSGAAADWVAQTVALEPAAASSITVTPPPGYAAGDFLLVTVAAQNLGSGSICTPAGAPTWNAVATTTTGSGSNELTEQTFWTMSGAPGYTFNFYATCANKTPLPAGGSFLAINYTGVDATTPLDNVVPQSASGPPPTAPTPNAVTTESTDDEVVSIFAANAAQLTLSGGTVENGGSTSIAENAQIQNVPKSVTPGSAGVSPTGAGWSAQTLALRPALPSAITVTPPSGYSPGAGDFLLVSLAVQNLGSGSICAPASWKAIATTTSGSGATELTQETFWTTMATAYTFTFYASSSCTGNTVDAAASEIATNYNGVDVATAPQVSSTPATNPKGATLTAPQLATTSADDEIVSMFATNAAFNGTPPSVTNAPSSDWTNSGEDNLVQPTIGDQTTPATATTAAAANWTAETVAITPLLSSSITITPPSGYATGDLFVISVAVQNLATNSICAPDSTWAEVPASKVTSGTLTQEVFWTTTSSTPSDVFTFYPSASCSGTPVDLEASAVAVNYTGVNPVDPFDVAPSSSSGTSSPLTPSGVTTNSPGDEVVSLFATSASALTVPAPSIVSTGGATSNSGAANALEPTAGATTTGVATPPGDATSTPASASWTTVTLALKALATTGVSISRPPTPAANDFILVTVTANGLSSSDTICPPNDGTWTEIGSMITQGGTLSQATFYSFRSSADRETYTFTFLNGQCPSGGSPVSAHASALAVRYTGVNPIIPIDQSKPTSGTGASITTASVTPTYANDELVGLYGTAATSFASGIPAAQTSSGDASATGFTDSNAPAAGKPDSPANATITSNNWIEQTVALNAESGGCNGCVYGLEIPPTLTYDTSYAQPINTSVAQLQTEDMSHPGQNALILLSDGDANTTAGLTPASDPCQQGIAAAQAAESPPYDDWVFVIAYGALTNSSGCTLDTSNFPGINYDNQEGLTPQCALELMVDNPVTNPAFVGDTDAYVADQICSSSVVTTIPGTNRYFGQQSDTDLEKVFREVGNSLTSSRLLPPSAT